MKTAIIALTFFYCFLACKNRAPHDENSDKNLLESNNVNFKSMEVKKDTFLFDYFGDTDTSFLKGNLKIKIIGTPLKSFVTQVKEDGAFLRTYNYHDYSYKLLISFRDSVFLDTFFSKQEYLKHTSKEFIDSSTFYGYWIEKYDSKSDRLIFFGNISQPETDWGYQFRNIFDLKTKRLFFEELD